jgi:hypothetical protein
MSLSWSAAAVESLTFTILIVKFMALDQIRPRWIISSVFVLIAVVCLSVAYDSRIQSRSRVYFQRATCAVCEVIFLVEREKQQTSKYPITISPKHKEVGKRYGVKVNYESGDDWYVITAEYEQQFMGVVFDSRNGTVQTISF